MDRIQNVQRARHTTGFEINDIGNRGGGRFQNHTIHAAVLHDVARHETTE